MIIWKAVIDCDYRLQLPHVCKAHVQQLPDPRCCVENLMSRKLKVKCAYTQMYSSIHHLQGKVINSLQNHCAYCMCLSESSLRLVAISLVSPYWQNHHDSLSLSVIVLGNAGSSGSPLTPSPGDVLQVAVLLGERHRALRGGQSDWNIHLSCQPPGKMAHNLRW